MIMLVSNRLSTPSTLDISNGLALYTFPDIAKIGTMVLIDKMTENK